MDLHELQILQLLVGIQTVVVGLAVILLIVYLGDVGRLIKPKAPKDTSARIMETKPIPPEEIKEAVKKAPPKRTKTQETTTLAEEPYKRRDK